MVSTIPLILWFFSSLWVSWLENARARKTLNLPWWRHGPGKSGTPQTSLQVHKASRRLAAQWGCVNTDCESPVWRTTATEKMNTLYYLYHRITESLFNSLSEYIKGKTHAIRKAVNKCDCWGYCSFPNFQISLIVCVYRTT